MARRWLLNLTLALLLALLWGLAHWDLAREQRATRLTPLHAERVQRIALHRADEPRLLLVRGERGWDMHEPWRAPADGARIARLLAITAAPSHRTLPAAAADPAALGLLAPRWRLLLDGLELRLGDQAALGAQRYVQVGDLIHLIEDRFQPHLGAPAAAYLARTLLPPGFSPGIGRLDGQPLSADALATLATSEAVRVEPLAGTLGGHLLEIQSADGDPALRFLISADGSHWSRADLRLTYILAQPPLAWQRPQRTNPTNSEHDEPFAPAAEAPATAHD
ncbi:MAG: hypothetical protein EA400_14070 [Chromatiaceae bacterium]|nr:MAG: hypothetical protein EA400_14070 [Chromatiaceae bacterium]